MDAASFLSPGEIVREKVLLVEEIDGNTCVTVPYLTGTLRTRRWEKVEKIPRRTKRGIRWVLPPKRKGYLP